MNKFLASIHFPGRQTVLAALLASLSLPALATGSPNIVISQVYGGGGNSGAEYRQDFIEIFNRSSADVAIGGWSVQYASSAGTTWQVSAIPAGTVLKAGQYYLIRQAAGTGGTRDVPSDAAGGLNLSGTAGKVALAKNSTALSGATPTSAALVDLVGFGNSAGYEGLPTPVLSNTKSASRNDGGCADTDHNLTDFTVGAPDPRNSASPFKACNLDPVAEPIVANCPATLLRPHGELASRSLNAIDKDSRVTGATITSSPVAGIRLEEFAASGAVNSAAAVKLVVDAAVVPGNHPVTINFTNDANQAQSCTVTVRSADTNTIPAIQGSGAESPLNRTAQTTEGVITAKVGSGYFIQDPAGDGDPTTSDGIFVFGQTSGSVGQRVRVTGLVTEYAPSGATSTYTELTDAVSSVLGAGQAVSAANITLPGSDLEAHEGMLVRFTNPLTVNDNKYLGARGELTLSSGRREIPTNRYRPRTPEAQAMAADNAANAIVLDDGLFVTPAVIPYIGADGTVRAGDTVTGLEGVLDFGSLGGGGAGFKLQPTVAPQFSRTNPRPAAPNLPAGIKVASANVLNFFTTFTNGSTADGATGQGCKIGTSTRASNCRGADNMDEFVRQRDKIVKSLIALDADVVGLMEIQNNGDTAVGYLVDSLNTALGAPVYAVVPKPEATGTDAIRVAMIYKPASVSLVGSALSDGDRVNNRPPMAQTFRANNDAKFSVIVNHLKAKAGCDKDSGLDTDQGDGQGCWNATRVLQAQRLANVFIPQVVASANDPDVLVIGDMNAYGFEDPIATLLGAGMVNELERFVRPQGMVYSYVFDGEVGYLDHALTSASLSKQVLGAAEWHNNADEPEAIDYNKESKPQDLYVDNAYRASDHDPVIVSLGLTPPYVDVTGSVRVVQSGLAVNYAAQQYSGKVMFTNTGSTTLNGPLHFVLRGLTQGVVLNGAHGSHKGAPYLTLPQTTLAPGEKVTVEFSFTYGEKKKSIDYTPKLFSGDLQP
ncbi:ExeM/NucH family extracellular endonuclease [Massilia sp. BSC265]|uniref:ExeM/NucH family extracellular endonuclease n=1 Tax=Massilia sp. BSC265 TaxID=1549812 RepID=UPI0004E91BE4|nr:ExeM/NucH family extracellular endonuclease [Massilia sp. BSC265]KFI05599.1 endonuclease/exonuclease/phosphatase [Massilia sp. BSC265]